MEREILFRAKRVDNNEWVYGSYINTCSEHEISDINCIVGSVHEVIPETVGQFTGLTDKNGVKIFENDKTNMGVVLFKNGCFGIESEINNFKSVREAVKKTGLNQSGISSCLSGRYITTGGFNFEYEVIGNIHEK